MNAPRFWHHKGHIISIILLPLSWLYRLAHRIRWNITTPHKANIPVLCVGNIIAGGAGKTPVVLELAHLLKKRGYTPHIISRGYGGTLHNTTCVTDAHTAQQVGDEPLLHHKHAPCWVSSDRKAAIISAETSGADCVIMDDGFQNPSIYKDLSILVSDGGYGLGNGCVIPSGPMRETTKSAYARAQALCITGNTNLSHNTPDHVTQLTANIVPDCPESLHNKNLLAFCGIARPQKFYDTLKQCSAKILETQNFPDHHYFSEDELSRLYETASRYNATLITTHKDWVRLDSVWKQRVEYLPISLNISPSDALDALLDISFPQKL